MEKHISSARNQDAIDWFTEELARFNGMAEHYVEAVTQPTVQIKPHIRLCDAVSDARIGDEAT